MTEEDTIVVQVPVHYDEQTVEHVSETFAEGFSDDVKVVAIPKNIDLLTQEELSNFVDELQEILNDG